MEGKGNARNRNDEGLIEIHKQRLKTVHNRLCSIYSSLRSPKPLPSETVWQAFWSICNWSLSQGLSDLEGLRSSRKSPLCVPYYSQIRRTKSCTEYIRGIQKKRKGKNVQILQRVSWIQNCVHSEDSACTNIDTGIVSSSEFEYLEALRKSYHCDDEPGGPVPRVFFVLVNRLPSTNPSFSFRVPPNWYYLRLITPSCAWQSTNCTYAFALHTYASSILPLANERIRLCAVFALSIQMPFHFLTGSWLNLSDDSRACKRLPPPLSLSPLQSFS